jgi:ABC-type sugar transport system ATPase subunit
MPPRTSTPADPAPSQAGATAVLRMRGIEKRYGGVHALRGAALTIGRPGVVHALIGENGSGKSSLLGVLAGSVRADRGTIEIEGEECSFRSPVDSVARGIAMVSQEIAVAPDLTIAENVLLGHRLARDRAGVSPRKSRERAREILEGLGLDYDPAAVVRGLRPDQRQMIEIARAVSMDAQILILDEPTSSLTEDEVEGLFATIRRLKAQGVSILFVSHRLDDLFAVADEATVLRDGVTVCEAPMAEMDADRIVSEMVGEPIKQTTRGYGGRPRDPGAAIALDVKGLDVPGCLSGIEFAIHAGEVVGVAGLAGSGRSELLEALFGVRPSAGTVEIGGEPFRPTDPRASIRAGIGLLPRERKTEGLSLAMSVRDNLTAIHNLRRPRLARPRRRREDAVATQAATAMGVKAASLSAPVGSLSGGNQQKVALGRWLAVEQKVLLLDEPTRGVDIAAKWEIHRRLRHLAESGLALLVSSSENDELLELCDSILVLFRGRLVASLNRDQASDERLARLSGGQL